MPLRSHTMLIGLVLAGSAGAVELTGTLRADPLRVGSTQLVGVGPELTKVLSGAAASSPDVQIEASSADEGLPLPGDARPERAKLRGIRCHVVADTRLLAAGGRAAEAIKANTPMWIVAARQSGGDTLVEVKHGLDEASRWISSSLVRIGGDWLGTRVGETLAPVFGSISHARKARTFHPDGSVWAAQVTPLAAPEPFTAPARRLGGAAVVRIGAGLLKHGQLPGLPDLLSLAVRFKATPAAGQPLVHAVAPGDQDLFVTAETERFSDFFNPTIPTVWAEEHDYFANTYHPAQKFLLEGTGKTVWVRLVPVLAGEDLRQGPFLRIAAAQMFEAGQVEEGMKLLRDAERMKKESNAADRERKLAERVAAGTAVFRLEVQQLANPVRRFFDLDRGLTKSWFAHPWVPLCEIRLTAPLDLDQEAMHYHPDLAGRGLVPTGTIPSIRPAVYRASQDARPKTEAERQGGITGVVEIVEPKK